MLTHVRSVHAELDMHPRHWVDGTVHLPYRPSLSADLVLPEFTMALALGTHVDDDAPDDICSDLDDGNGPTRIRFSQSTLARVVEVDAWHRTKAECAAFDRHIGADRSIARNREQARLVSCSQPGSGAWTTRVPRLAL